MEFMEIPKWVTHLICVRLIKAARLHSLAVTGKQVWHPNNPDTPPCPPRPPNPHPPTRLAFPPNKATSDPFDPFLQRIERAALSAGASQLYARLVGLGIDSLSLICCRVLFVFTAEFVSVYSGLGERRDKTRTALCCAVIKRSVCIHVLLYSR